MRDSSRVRRPAVAGSFYPADPDRLRDDIRAFLDNARAAHVAGRPLVLVEPHAGYVYSGQIAAYGFKLLQDLDVRTVFIISPSHMEYFPFVSIFDGDAYETPLGTIPVDTELAREIAGAADGLELSERGHIQPRSPRKEHALEVQLPFLQTVLGDFKIIPMVMGDQHLDYCRALGEALAPLLDVPGTLAVVSSDLSHFHSYDVAREKDDLFCRLLEDMDPWRLYESVRSSECEACGAGPVVASLIASRGAHATGCQVLHAANSGDVTGERGQVVGYASAVVVKDENSRAYRRERSGETALPVGATERVYLLAIARRAIEKACGVEVRDVTPVESPVLDAKSAAFVTLKIAGRLRGCVGTIEPRKSLRENVVEMAEAAAFNDPRFEKLGRNELESMDVEISVLSPLHLIYSPEDIEVGRHGLVVEGDERRGLLLPQVAAEHGWDPVTFLEYTCEKAALPRDAWKQDGVRVRVFTATVFGEKTEVSR